MNKAWVNIYRTYSVEELAATIAKLKADADNPYASQTIGDKAYQRALSESRDKLEAAVIVQDERSGRTATRRGVADFSGIRVT